MNFICTHYGHVIVCSCPLLPRRCEELWCGLAQQRSGKLSVWNMTSQQHRELTHAQQAENRTVHAVVTDADGDACWTYVYPGSEVYRWNVDVKQVTHLPAKSRDRATGRFPGRRGLLVSGPQTGWWTPRKTATMGGRRA